MASHHDDEPKLEKPYWIPFHGTFSKNPQRYLMYLDADPRFDDVAQNLPETEIAYLRKLCPLEAGQEDQSDHTCRLHLVLSRLSNRICDTCYDKSDVWALKWCSACKLTFYCSEKCRAKAYKKHKLWCCQQRAPVDDGPMQIVVHKIK